MNKETRIKRTGKNIHLLPYLSGMHDRNICFCLFPRQRGFDFCSPSSAKQDFELIRYCNSAELSAKYLQVNVYSSWQANTVLGLPTILFQMLFFLCYSCTKFLPCKTEEWNPVSSSLSGISACPSAAEPKNKAALLVTVHSQRENKPYLYSSSFQNRDQRRSTVRKSIIQANKQ